MMPMSKQRAPVPYLTAPGFTLPGFTLIEAGIALAVIGLVVGGIWVAASKAQTSVQVTTLAEQVHQIADNVRGLYISQRGMFTDNTQATVNGAACGAANFNARLSCLGGYPADMAAGGPGGDAFHAFDQARGVLGKNFNRVMPIRIVDVISGRGPVLFGRNDVIAAKLAKDEALENPRILGTAYEVPADATLFIASRQWGLPRALTHASPNASPRVNNTPVRELSIYDCKGLI